MEQSFYCTIDQKLRNFQYKYLMQIVRTNDFLLKCKLVQSNICDFCNMHVETVQHLFWECMYTQNFWQKLVDFLKSKDIDVTSKVGGHTKIAHLTPFDRLYF